MADVRAIVATAVDHLRAGRVADALAAAQQAVRRAPTDAGALHVLGLALERSGRAEQAIYQFQRLVSMRPDDAACRFALARALLTQGQQDKALEQFLRCVQLGPVPDDRTMMSIGTALRVGRPDIAAQMGACLLQACRSWREELRVCCGLWNAGDAPTVIELMGAIETLIGKRASLQQAKLLSMQYGADVSARTIAAAHREAGAMIASVFPVDPSPFANTRERDRPLRIGYVSQDFRNRSAGHFIEPIITGHDRGAFEVFAYHHRLGEDELTARLKPAVRAWRDIEDLDEHELAALTRADRIDILVDLMGHSGLTRLGAFALRGAPVQATYMGYPDTTGLATMDYRLIDALTDPPGSDALATERLVRLDGCFLCYRPPPEAPAVTPAPAGKSAEGLITFGSFNVVAKINPRVVSVWSRVLHNVAGSRLLIKSSGLQHEGAAANVREAFEREGVAADRLTIHGETVDTRSHLGMYGQVDIALDTFPYNGTTTTLEALWMGVPVVTIEGDRHAARVSASILRNVGLGELVGTNTDEFVRIAVELARDRGRAGALRSGMRERLLASGLCDSKRFVLGLESAYRSMWRSWCDQPV